MLPGLEVEQVPSVPEPLQLRTGLCRVEDLRVVATQNPVYVVMALPYSDVVGALAERDLESAPVLRSAVRPDQVLCYRLRIAQEDGYLLVEVGIEHHPALLHQHPAEVLFGVVTYP